MAVEGSGERGELYHIELYLLNHIYNSCLSARLSAMDRRASLYPYATGGNLRPRRVEFATVVYPFRHISERVRALQSQTDDGAARALQGLPAAVPPAKRVSFPIIKVLHGHNSMEGIFFRPMAEKNDRVKKDGAKNPHGPPA